MTQENKELLIKDLCARLPYEVKVHAKYIDTITDVEVEKVGVLSMVDNDTIIAFTCDDTNCYNYVTIHEVKPYLFPMSSMTEEQSKTYHELVSGMFGTSTLINFEVLTDFFHKNHLDYRGLIPMGLAIDATGLNIY